MGELSAGLTGAPTHVPRGALAHARCLVSLSLSAGMSSSIVGPLLRTFIFILTHKPGNQGVGVLGSFTTPFSSCGGGRVRQERRTHGPREDPSAY